LLIDASPDLREQLFREGFSTPGHIMLTHTHNDHCFGLQELRSYYFAAGQQPTSVYVSGQHQEEVHRVFGYMTTGPQASLHLQGLEAIPSLGGLPVQTFPLIHGKGLSYGLRVGAFAYCTDLTDIPPESLPFLEGLDTWIVDCASRLEKRPGHLILPETVAWINRLQPRQAFLTHMGSSLDYETLRQELPASIRPCFDGMRLSLPLV
jgi:phosphoribosyl 1,2-cyclic phosphate phosphodiesterase